MVVAGHLKTAGSLSPTLSTVKRQALSAGTRYPIGRLIMDRCVVASGGFVQGFTFNGPFPNPRAALDWADYNLDPVRSKWTIAKLESPTDYDGPEGEVILMIGDGHNGHSVVGPFDTPESALDWEETRDADCEGYHVMRVHLSPPE